MKGIPASEGIAIGKVIIWDTEEPKIEKKAVQHGAEELERLAHAIDRSKDQLKDIQARVLEKMGPKEAQVFDAHLLLLEDPEWIGKIEKQVEDDLICSEYIVQQVTNEFVAIFEAMDNEYLRERAADLKDVSMRLIRNVMGLPTGLTGLGNEPVILAAKDLAPSDTAQLERGTVAGFLTEMGNKTSHSAIIARTMGIPALVGVKGLLQTLKEEAGSGKSAHAGPESTSGNATSTADGSPLSSSDLMVAFDGATGEIAVNPSEEILLGFEEKAKALAVERERNEAVRGLPSVTPDGHQVEIACNIAQPAEADYVIEHDGEGVGLFRSEFLFMDRSEPPTEDEQFYAYKLAAEKLAGRPLIIRTLDAGGDKHIPYLNVDEEMNPFLGYRAIRICLDDRDLFTTQIRAILRTSAYGKVKMMFPMIATVDEFLRAKTVVEEVKVELRGAGVSFDEGIELGIMVEIPSTAVMADAFAQHVDFFSIGTNDLTQYTLAADRMNQNLSGLYNHRDPAVLRLVKMVIDAAHFNGKWVGMCGEAAGDPHMIPVLLGLGLDEFSMAPSAVLPARRIIRSISKEEAENLAGQVVWMHTASEVEEQMKTFLEEIRHD